MPAIRVNGGFCGAWAVVRHTVPRRTSGTAQHGDLGVGMGGAVAGTHHTPPGDVVQDGISPVGEGGGGAPHTEV